MKIFRLAKFNIFKHKTESVSLIILIMICTSIMCSSVNSLLNVQNAFGRMVEQNHSIKDHFLISERDYHEQYDEYLKNYEGITDFKHIDCVSTEMTGVIDKEGKETNTFFIFVDEKNQIEMEDFNPETSMSDDEIAKTEHPIYLPFYVQDTLGRKIGDEFIITYNGRQFPYTIVGFYESCLYSDTMIRMKAVISDDDFAVMQNLTGRHHILAYSCEGVEPIRVVTDFREYIEDSTYNGEQMRTDPMLYESFEFSSSGYLKALLAVMASMAIVTLIAVLIMVRHRIGDDIREQVVSIGVLEALGYRSSEIMLSYIYEYLILGICGIIPGIFGAMGISKVIYSSARMLISHHYEIKTISGIYVILCLALLAFLILIAYLRARMVYKYPPVVAFRKGMSDYHFGKDVLPLSKTKGNVHLRLALKGFVSNIKESIGIGICIVIAATAVVTSLILYQFADDSMAVIYSISGMELADLEVTVSNDTDINAMKDELLSNPDIERILLANNNFTWDVQYDYYPNGSEEKVLYTMAPIVYDDYDDIHMINVLEGRYPQYDNEIMISKLDSNLFKLSVGDIFTLKKGKIQKDYIICGLVSEITNNGNNIYLTSAGYKRIKPYYKPCTLQLFLKEGVDPEDIRYQLTHTYGRSIDDALKSEITDDSLTERIKAIADKKMATLLSEYGVGHVEYSIIMGDEQISGSSSVFKTEQITSIKGIVNSQLGGAVSAFSAGSTFFIIISIVVVMVIMYMIMSAMVKSKRAELGIYKGLGYTSTDLRFQLAFRIVPTLIISVALGTVLGFAVLKILVSIIGSVPVNYVAILIADLIFILFSFVAAYVGTVKISRISVYELMTE